MPLLRPVKIVLLAALLGLGLAPAAGAATQITTPATLQPAFDTGVRDYIARCGTSSTLSLRVSSDQPVRVDGQRARTGTFVATVGGLSQGEPVSVVVGTGAAASTHTIRCVPSDFPRVNATKTGPTQAAAYFVTPTLVPPSAPYTVILDGNGTPVWWRRGPVGSLANDFKLLPNGNVSFHVARDWNPPGFSVSLLNNAQEWTLDGRFVRQIRSVGGPTDFHDLTQLPNGNSYTLSYRKRSDDTFGQVGRPSPQTVMENVVQEVDPQGRVVYEWSTQGRMTVQETGRWFDIPIVLNKSVGGETVVDWRHVNTVEPDGNGFLLSAKHTDALYRVDRATGDIDWKLGGTRTARSLAVVGAPDDAKLFGGQHDVRRLADGTITVFDNGTFQGRKPRAMRFAIDPVRRTATLLESVTDPEALGSFCCGSARKLAAGNWVVNWVSATKPFFSEVTPAGDPRLRVNFGGTRFSYRVIPVDPGAYPADAVRTGMDRMHPRTR